jgi:hypothetical protein
VSLLEFLLEVCNLLLLLQVGFNSRVVLLIGHLVITFVSFHLMDSCSQSEFALLCLVLVFLIELSNLVLMLLLLLR